MSINMPKKNTTQTTEEFIKNAPIIESNNLNKSEDLTKTSPITFSFQKQDILWMNETIKKLNSMTRQKISKSLLASAGLNFLKTKNEDELLTIIREI